MPRNTVPLMIPTEGRRLFLRRLSAAFICLSWPSLAKGAGRPEVRLKVDPLVGLAPLTIKVWIQARDYPAKAAVNLTIVGSNGYQAVSVRELGEAAGEILTLPDAYYPLSERGIYTVGVQIQTGDYLSEDGPVTVHASAVIGVEVS